MEEQYTAHGHLVTEKLTEKPLERRETLHLEIDHFHLESTRLINDSTPQLRNKTGSLRRCAEVNDEDFCIARQQTNEFFTLVEEWMEEILQSFQDFNKGLISILIRNLRTTIEEFNNAKANNFVFSPNYHVDMGLTVAGYSYKHFVAKLRQLDVENNPLETMDQLKPLFFRTFETQFSEASNDHAAVQNICSIITKPIINGLIEKLQIDIVYNMKSESSHYRKKNYFKVLVLKDLAAAKTFRHFTVYLKNVANSLKYWCKVHVKQYCKTKNSKGNTNLYNLSEVNLNDTITKIIDAIKYLHSQYCSKNPDVMDAVFSFSDEDLNGQDKSVHNFDMKEWLKSFHKSIKMTIAVDLQAMTDTVGIQSIHNLNFFTKQLIKSLKDESNKILLDIKNNPRATFEKLTDSAKSPHNVLYNSLIGCKEQCPFCKEQCELTDENHLDSGKPHYTEIHRPRCLAKYKHIDDNKLVLETCTNIEADYIFKNADTNDEYLPFKEYKKVYPNWLISTESPQTGPKYWEWFIANYNTDIIKWLRAAPTPVDAEGWNDITEEDAIDNLTEAYGLRTETN